MALHTWWLFVVTVFFISISPGPNMLHVMTRSVTLGFGRAMLAMNGCFLAVLTLLSLSAAGLSAVLVAMPQVFTALKIVGAGYLLYLGYKAWTAAGVRSRATTRRSRAVKAEVGGAPSVMRRRARRADRSARYRVSTRFPSRSFEHDRRGR